MVRRFWLPALGSLSLCACQPHSTTPNGATLLDEDVQLTRNDTKLVDEASRTLQVNDDAIIVATVEENLTDVELELRAGSRSTAVENHLQGSGIEVATIDAPKGSTLEVKLTGGEDWTKAGKVHVRVREYSPDAAHDPAYAPFVAGFRAWSAGTSTATRGATAKAATDELQRAIESLAKAPESDALVAEARLVRARLLTSNKVDWRESREEAVRAADAFAKLATPDALNQARARYVEAQALGILTQDSSSKNPTAEEALKLATDSLNALAADTSALPPVERARAFGALGQLDVMQMLAEPAFKHFGQASSIYRSQGYEAGEREVRLNLAQVLVEQGAFHDAASAFDELEAGIEKIRDPELKVNALLGAARAQTFSDRVDEGTETLLRALALARQSGLREAEATATESLGYVYQNRGDNLQARTYFDEALNLARGGKDVGELVSALSSAGQSARTRGEYELAYKLEREAVDRAPTPALQVRTRFGLAIELYQLGKLQAAIDMLREALAIDLHDPGSNVYTDGKLALARFLLEKDHRTREDLAEVERLVNDSMATSLKVQDTWRVIYSTRMRATLESARGQDDLARKDYERVFSLGRDYRAASGSTESRSTLLADEEIAYRGYLDLELANVAKRGAGAVAAVSPAELAAVLKFERARRETFGGLRVGKLDAKTAAHVDELFEQLGQKSLKVASLAGRDLTAAQAEELRELQIEMSRIHTELDMIRATAAEKKAGELAAAGAAQALRELAPGAAQVSYLLADTHVYALVRSASGTGITALAPSR